jgi:hypothetical protein
MTPIVVAEETAAMVELHCVWKPAREVNFEAAL